MEFQDEIQGLQGLRALSQAKAASYWGGFGKEPVPIFLTQTLFKVITLAL